MIILIFIANFIQFYTIIIQFYTIKRKYNKILDKYFINDSINMFHKE